MNDLKDVRSGAQDNSVGAVEFKTDGVAYTETQPLPKKTIVRGRNLCTSNSPKIYVDDGSNGTNLINTYSYRNYNIGNEKPSIQNRYSNNYKTSLTSNPEYDAIDGLRLHKTSDSGGYSNFTVQQFVK